MSTFILLPPFRGILSVSVYDTFHADNVLHLSQLGDKHIELLNSSDAAGHDKICVAVFEHLCGQLGDGYAHFRCDCGNVCQQRDIVVGNNVQRCLEYRIVVLGCIFCPCDFYPAVAGTYSEHLLYFNPGEINLAKGTKVRITGGQFEGYEGVFVKVKGSRDRRVVISLQGILALAMATLSPDLIEVIEEPKKRNHD